MRHPAPTLDPTWRRHAYSKVISTKAPVGLGDKKLLGWRCQKEAFHTCATEQGTEAALAAVQCEHQVQRAAFLHAGCCKSGLVPQLPSSVDEVLELSGDAILRLRQAKWVELFLQQCSSGLYEPAGQSTKKHCPPGSCS